MTTTNTTRDEATPQQTPRGPLGDARPHPDTDDSRANPGQPPEPVEERPGVGSVTPEDYPAKDRADSSPDGGT